MTQWEWEGEQNISPPDGPDADDVRARVKWVRGLVEERYGPPGLVGRRADLDLLQRVIDDGVIGKDQTFQLQSLGLAFGEVLVNEVGFHWVIVEDKYGRDPAIKFRSTSVLAFPLTMISKRIERDERPDLQYLLRSVRREVAQHAAESDPKPG